MSEIKWRDIYSVGVEKFDNQHKHLIKILNELLNAMHNGLASVILADKLDELVEYAHTHFAEEEKLFEQYDYPKKEEHLIQHKKLLNDILKLKENLSKGGIIVSLKTTDFLKDWLINHILGEDMQYTTFFKEKGIS